jgi:2-keto-3-deoxy-L-rhamnonate aldolase RhmA
MQGVGLREGKMRENALRKKLTAGENAFGLWSMMGSEAVLEMAGPLGFDWVLIDCEHGVASIDALPGLLRALNGSQTTSVVRMPGADNLSEFKRVLDAGAEGVLVPLVYTADQVKDIVGACRYPPKGTRGIAAGRAHQYGHDFMDYLARSNSEVLVFVQAETREAIENIDEIMNVDGLDGVLIGPVDLSTALNKPFDFKSPEFRAAADQVLQAAKRAGKFAGFYCSDPAEARARMAEGFQFVNICTDMLVLLRGYLEALKTLKER